MRFFSLAAISSISSAVAIKEQSQEDEKLWGTLAMMAAPHVINAASKLFGEDMEELNLDQNDEQLWGTIAMMAAPHVINAASKLFGENLEELNFA